MASGEIGVRGQEQEQESGSLVGVFVVSGSAASVV